MGELSVPREPSEKMPDLRGALDRIDDGFVVYDREWRILYVNRSAERYFSRPRKDLLGRIVWEAFPAAVGTDAERELRRAAASPDPTDLEIFSPAMRRWVAIRVFPSEGSVSVSFRDVTAGKETTDALRASEARYRAIFEHAADGMLLTAPTGEILAANPAACRMLGRTEAEICEVGRAGIMDATDPRLGPALEERRRTGFLRTELTCVRKDGTRFPVEISSAIYLDAEGRERTSMTIRDLTDAQLARDRLRLIADAGAVLGSSLESEATLSELTHLVVPRLADYCVVDFVEEGALRRVAGSHRDPARDPALMVSSGPILERNAGLFKVARTGEPELTPVVDDAWLHATTRDDAHLAIARANGPRSAVMVPILGRAGVIGVLSLLIIDESRRYDVSDLATAQAIADRAGLAIENARLYEQAVQAKRLRADMLGIVSHDLRNPLNAIHLNARVLARVQGAPVPELLAIERSVRHADSLIQDLLSVAALEAGAMPLQKTPQRLASIIEEATELQRAPAADRSLVLESTVDPDVPDVDVDRHRFLQALSNLLDNALKFTPPGGRVLVEGRRADGAVVVKVSDTGPGIPPTALPHVFDRFWQVAETRRAGAGLGLAITKGIVEAHGGTVSVESEPGRGATFSIRIPVAPHEP